MNRLRWALMAITLATAASALAIDLVVAHPEFGERWHDLPDGAQEALWRNIALVVVGAPIVAVIAHAVVKWSPSVPAWVINSWIVSGGLASVSAVALWANMAISYTDPPQGSPVSLALGTLPWLAATIAFVTLVISALRARRRARRESRTLT